ncbi:MAG: response regulator [Gammaproteobacteria bacterium]|nr:MAG: response regulator [Gammaproteobacteria bacterium]
MLGEDMRDVVNILVVEDDEIDVEALKRLFAKRDIKNPVYYAANGIEALDIMRGENTKAKVPKPFIVLLDINMPMMNGIEMLRELRADETLRDTIVFVLTTSPRDEDKTTSYQLNVAGYFLKKDVKELVNLLSLYWQLNEFPEN